jgi:hypothetical protein
VVNGASIDCARLHRHRAGPDRHRRVTQAWHLPHFMILRFANQLARLGYAARGQGSYFATISGRQIDAVMQGRLR